jgi:DNA adenine methylase
MRKPRSYAEVYSELDAEIVNVFRVLRDPLKAYQLLAMLKDTPFAREEFDGSYEPSDDELEQSRRTLVRSFMGFGSPAASGGKTGFRFNSSRIGTIPAMDWRNVGDALPFWCDRLRGVVIENRLASEVMLQHDGPDTLHFADPPYVFETRSKGNPYCKKGYRHEMTDDDHVELAGVLHNLKGMVMLSGYRCDLYDGLYEGWESMERNSLADGARPRVECLWFNPSASMRSGRQGLLSEVMA